MPPRLGFAQPPIGVTKRRKKRAAERSVDMKRWLIIFAFLGLLITVACGLEFAVLFSAKVEQIAFLLVPPVFLAGSVIGLAGFRQS